MIGVMYFMIKNKGPLMFINTVNTEIQSTNEQEIYDSRLSKKKLIRKFIDERKLRNIVDMYNKNKPILCNIILEGEEVVGIPYQINENEILVKLEDGSTKEIMLDKIFDVIIIKF